MDAMSLAIPFLVALAVGPVAQTSVRRQVYTAGTYRAAVETHVITMTDPVGWWGSPETSAYPRRVRVVRTVRVTHGRDRVYLPVAAYSGLAQPDAIQLKPIKNGCELWIDGGGGAHGGYRAILTFKGDAITERHVSENEFADERFERTTYRYAPDRGR